MFKHYFWGIIYFQVVLRSIKAGIGLVLSEKHGVDLYSSLHYLKKW